MTDSDSAINTSEQSAAAGPSGSADIKIWKETAGAHVLLNRPKALNTITPSMIAALLKELPGFGRDPDIYALIIRSAGPKVFCAGGDVRETLRLNDKATDLAREALGAEYALIWYLECFTKPILSLIDGLVMGSGVGLTLYGTHRVAGQGYAFAMPEVAIGLFPDVGVTSVLARMPDEIGMYLGLTGARINAADAYHLGLVTHCIGANQFDDIAALVGDAEPIDAVLDARHVDPGTSSIADRASVIAQCFAAPDVSAILQRLKDVSGSHAQWAQETIKAMTGAAPLSLKVTHRMIRAAQTMDLRQTLIFDYRLVCRFLEGPDFTEGVRAALIDKDRKPKWQPACLADVSDEMIDAYFAPMPDGGSGGEQSGEQRGDLGGELELAPRAQMQKTRA